MEFKKDKFIISDDPSRLDIEAICDFLSRAYWADKRPRRLIERSIKHSLNFGVYDGERQIGFARVVTDQAIFAYLCDVFIHEDYRVAKGKLKEKIKEFLPTSEQGAYIAVKVNAVSTLASAVESGLGLGLLPCFIGAQLANVVRIAAIRPNSETGMWVLTHPDLKKAARVRAFLDYYGAELARKRRLIEGEEG